ncbi:MAG TPA: hypothetical protein VG406_04365 [Isosphaeraceae bacterium]|jgi:hypothetical protein|nr:hypothetical protein [Isosphaeraceae bacterium]
MPETFDRDDLDALAADCGAPDAPGSDGQPITLSGRCHPGAPSTCRVRAPGRVVAACAECARPFAQLEVDSRREVVPLARHPDCGLGFGPDEVLLTYARGTGVVRVACAGCGQTLGELAMRRRGRLTDPAIASDPSGS